MIRINVNRNANNEIIGFTVKGHAYAEEPGKDIVCAAVSMLTQTTLLGLHEVAHIEFNYKIHHGNLSCELPQTLTAKQRENANILLETMLMGINNIHQQYADAKYIEIHDKEV